MIPLYYKIKTSILVNRLKRTISILIICWLLLAICSAQISRAILVDATAITICQRPFREAIDWEGLMWSPPEMQSLADTEWEEVLSIMIPQVIAAGEIFLNNCVDFESPLSEQAEILVDMEELATMIYPSYLLPPNWQEQNSHSAQVQLVNLDNDDSSELLLAARIINPTGNFYVIYNLSDSTQTWHGTLVWPGSDGDYSLFHSYAGEPTIHRLNFANSDKRSYVLVVGRFHGADHSVEQVGVWRWENARLETILKITLSDWCGPDWHNWRIIEKGIMVNATASTTRCEARDTVFYYLEEGQFTSTTP